MHTYSNSRAAILRSARCVCVQFVCVSVSSEQVLPPFVLSIPINQTQTQTHKHKHANTQTRKHKYDIHFSEWRKGQVPVSYGLAQNTITICPVVHSNYRLGTYAIAVEAALDTSFFVEVVASTQVHGK